MAFRVKVINGKQPSSGVGGVSDADVSNIAVNFVTKGIVKATDFLVAAQGTPNMSVLVPTGIAYIPNGSGSMIYCVELDASQNVNVANNASGNPRIDALVIKIDLSLTPDNFGGNVPSLVIVQGTPAASPSAPDDTAVQSAVGAGNPFLRIAEVTVANGAAQIVSGNIADKRVAAQFKLLSGRFQYNLSTNKLQFSNDSGSTWKDIGSGTAVPTFTVVGNLATGTSLSPLIIAPFNLTIIRASARVKTAPTGASIIVDIKKNGTSIWNVTPGNRLSVAASAQLGTQSSFDTTSVLQDDALSLDIAQVGSTVTGADLTVELYCTAS